MKHSHALVIVLSVILFLLTACDASIWDILAAQPSSTWLQIRDGDCDTICVYDIEVDATSFDEARSRILANVDESKIYFNGPYGMDFYTEIDGREVVVRLVHRDDIVWRITLQAVYPDNVMTLGELIDASFEPSRVFRNRVNGPNTLNLLIVFDDPRVNATITAQNTLDADAVVKRLEVVSTTYAEFVPTFIDDLRSYDTEIEWLGYTDIEAYFSD